LLPYLIIYVDISVQGSGVVRPVTEKTEIKSAITELVDSVYVREGDRVNKGDDRQCSFHDYPAVVV